MQILILFAQLAYREEAVMKEIRSYMSENLSVISSEATAQEAANTMLEKLIHSLIVVEGDNHIGIVTDE